MTTAPAPTSTPLRISAADGYALSATLWEAPGPLVVVGSATGVPQRYYRLFAEHLAARGFGVLTYDYRGIGASRPERMRGFDARLRDWGMLDLEGVLRFARKDFAGRRLLYVGHSVGGQVLGMAASNEVLEGAVTVGSQGGWWGHWTGPRRLAMAGLWHVVMPGTTRLVGYLPGSLGIGADLPKQVALEWARWGRSRNFFLDDGVPLDGFHRLRVPLTSFSFTDDSYAPKPGVDWLHGLYANAQVRRRHLAPADLGAREVGHFGPFRSVFRRTLWEQIIAALDAGPEAARQAPHTPR